MDLENLPQLEIQTPADLDPFGAFATRLGIGINMVDRDLRVVWSNEFTKQRLADICTGEPVHCFAAMWNRDRRCDDCLPSIVFGTGMPQSGIRRRGKPGGPVDLYEIRAIPVSSRSGNQQWVLECFINVTRGKATTAGGLSETQLLNELTSTLGSAFLMVDGNNNIVSWSPFAEQMFGYTVDEALGKRLDIILPPGGERDALTLMERSRSETRIPRFEAMRRHKDGRLLPVAITSMAVFDGDQHFTGRTELVEDLSTLSDLRHRLAAQEQMLAHMTRKSTDLIVELDTAGIITTWTPNTGLAFGYQESDIRGKSLAELTGSVVARELLRQVNTATVVLGERMEWLGATGSRHPVEVTAVLLARDHLPGTPYIALVVKDVSSKLLLERQMLRSEKLAVVGSIAAGLAHEIGTPLNVISATAELLFLEGNTDPRQRAELQTIVEETERISKLVNQLLAFAREQEPQESRANVNAVVQRVLGLLKVRLEGVHLAVDLSADTPDVAVAPDELHQIILNLLINARNAGGKGCAIQIRSQSAHLSRGVTAPTAKIEISDNGPGIPDALRERIFDPFFTTRPDGTGLGLSVCSRIISQRGGDISVSTSPLGGALFTIQLPRAKEDQ